MRTGLVWGAVAALGLSVPAFAQDGFSYSYVDVGYVSTSIDDSDLDSDGIGISGAVELNDRVHLIAGYSNEDFDIGHFHLAMADGRLHGEDAPGEDVRSLSLFRDDFVCVVDRNHPEVGEEMTLELYQRLPHNVVRFGTGIFIIVEQGWNDAKLNLNIASIAPSFSTLIFMLPGTPLVATAQRRLAKMLASSLPLRLLECPVKLDSLQENLTWHVRNEFDPCHQYLRRTFQAAAAELDAQGGGLCG